MDRPMCATCPYYMADPDDEHPVIVVDDSLEADWPGECHRMPPVPLSINLFPKDFRGDNENNEYISWPQVSANDWCGEHPDFPAYIKSSRTDKDAIGIVPA